MKILCIIPVYNAQDTLKGAIESVINQSYTNWELVIVDDASTDKSYKIAQSYSKRYPNITVLRNYTNQGCFYSRNRALYYMKDKNWDIFTIHDADDTSTLDRFTHYINTFNNNPKLSVILGVFNGKRYQTMANPPQIQYIKEGIATGINWYKRDIFITFGYFYPTRFAGDMEYTQRIVEYLARIVPEGKTVVEFKDEIMAKLESKYSYTYTTGFHSKGNLTQIYDKETRAEFRNKIEAEHYNANSPQEFYTDFIPHQKDL